MESPLAPGPTAPVRTEKELEESGLQVGAHDSKRKQLIAALSALATTFTLCVIILIGSGILNAPAPLKMRRPLSPNPHWRPSLPTTSIDETVTQVAGESHYAIYGYVDELCQMPVYFSQGNGPATCPLRVGPQEVKRVTFWSTSSNETGENDLYAALLENKPPGCAKKNIVQRLKENVTCEPAEISNSFNIYRLGADEDDD